MQHGVRLLNRQMEIKRERNSSSVSSVTSRSLSSNDEAKKKALGNLRRSQNEEPFAFRELECKVSDR